MHGAPVHYIYGACVRLIGLLGSGVLAAIFALSFGETWVLGVELKHSHRATFSHQSLGHVGTFQKRHVLVVLKGLTLKRGRKCQISRFFL